MAEMTKADEAVRYLIRRMQRDSRFASFMDPFTESYALLTEAYAKAAGFDVELFRKDLNKAMTFEAWPKEAECPACHERFPIVRR